MPYLIICIFFSGISGKIQGVVKDEDSGEPIPYADVVLMDTEIGATIICGPLLLPEDKNYKLCHTEVMQN